MINKLKKIVVAGGVMSVLFLAPVAEASFPDVPSDYWGKTHIDHLVGLGALHGYPDGRFGINDNVTRAQAAKIIAESLNLEKKEVKKSRFKDVPDRHWAKGYIETLSEEGIIHGYEGNLFKPNDSLTRGQMAKILAVSFDLKEKSSENFIDVKSSQWFYEYITLLRASNITSGYEDNTYRPNNDVTRAHLAAFVSRGITMMETEIPDNDNDVDNDVPKPEPEEDKPEVEEVEPNQPSIEGDIDVLAFEYIGVEQAGKQVVVSLLIHESVTKEEMLSFSIGYEKELLRINSNVEKVKINFHKGTSSKWEETPSAVYENGKL